MSLETVIHEMALRVHVADLGTSRAQLRFILDRIEEGCASVRVVPFGREGFAGAGASLMYLGGSVPRLDTGLRDSPTGVEFCDAEAQLRQLRTLFHKVEEASLDTSASRDFIHQLAKEL